MAGAKGIFAVGLSEDRMERKQDHHRLWEFGCKKFCLNYAAQHTGDSVRDEVWGHPEAAKEREAGANFEILLWNIAPSKYGIGLGNT